MRTFLPPHSANAARRGSALITALLIAAALGIGLVGYLSLSKTALKLAHRTLFVNDASNLAEAGLEEAIYSFNQMNAGVAAATAWKGWTISGGNATRTLPAFNRDQNGVGTVKVFVTDYLGSSGPGVISQATITSFDGSAPIVRVLKLGFSGGGGLFSFGLVGLKGIDLNGKPSFDSFNSNPTNNPNGPWVDYSSSLATANTTLVVPDGALDLGGGTVNGSVLVGKAVAPPDAKQVTGAIQLDYTGAFPMPAFPTAASVSQSYNLGSKLPGTLPATGDKPAADGRYYYFVSDATIGKTTIAKGTNVTIVGSKTSMSSGLTINDDATCTVYMDGTVSASGKGSINSGNWAGALQIFTTTSGTCEISGNGELQACLYAPNATLKVSGGGNSGQLVGSFIARTITANGKVNFHFDEALRNLNTAGGGGQWSLSSWEEMRFGSDLTALRTATGSFLP